MQFASDADKYLIQKPFVTGLRPPLLQRQAESGSPGRDWMACSCPRPCHRSPPLTNLTVPLRRADVVLNDHADLKVRATSSSSLEGAGSWVWSMRPVTLEGRSAKGSDSFPDRFWTVD
jgi:hypothetical protein